MLQAHYTSVLDISQEALDASEKGYQKLMDAVKQLTKINPGKKAGEFYPEQWLKKCYAAMNDDFNSPLLIAHLFEAVKFINRVAYKDHPIDESQLEILKKMLSTFIHDVLGIAPMQKFSSSKEKILHKTIALLIELRNNARNNKDFKTSDRIRDQLLDFGIQLNDGRKGTHFTLN